MTMTGDVEWGQTIKGAHGAEHIRVLYGAEDRQMEAGSASSTLRSKPSNDKGAMPC